MFFFFSYRVNKKSNIKGQTQKVTLTLDDGDDEGLALLIPDIQETAVLVQNSVKNDEKSAMNEDGEQQNQMAVERPLSSSIEQRYLEIMKKLQFGKQIQIYSKLLCLLQRIREFLFFDLQTLMK